jgi:adenine-specific DNA-methyltransferase
MDSPGRRHPSGIVEGTTRMDSNRIGAAPAELGDRPRRAELGQYMTPASIARFMASLFPVSQMETIRLLDPGAGEGALSLAFLERTGEGEFGSNQVEVTAYEIDPLLRARLTASLEGLAEPLHAKVAIRGDDFVEGALNILQFTNERFTHAILNPPYVKIGTQSRHRRLLHQAGIETVNLYSAFVALTLLVMQRGGFVVAITPRSFCNGPYYRPFRDLLLSKSAIHRIHLFGSRTSAFSHDSVLQENVILVFERGGCQGPVTISTSTDQSLGDLSATQYPFERIVFPDDEEQFIHVPTSPEYSSLERSGSISSSLQDLGIEVSTGPVVDFRVKAHLRALPGPDTVPLLYPSHFAKQSMRWPLSQGRKPNALALNAETQRWVYPNAFYTVVRRFSSKEEKRRIVASLVSPNAFDASFVGFENHLNVFHAGKGGLPAALARGLAVYLNATMVDGYFRRFSGHTQVNATDLRLIRYPDRATLVALGEWAAQHSELTQQEIDRKVSSIE